jgi:small subunit ribosomal protein S17
MPLGDRARRVGRVTSDRADKTIVVEIESVKRHRIYGKAVRVRRKLMAHDPENVCRIGDVVEIEESRPMSRRKRWRLFDLVKRSELSVEEKEAVYAPVAPEILGETGGAQNDAGLVPDDLDVDEIDANPGTTQPEEVLDDDSTAKSP